MLIQRVCTHPKTILPICTIPKQMQHNKWCAQAVHHDNSLFSTRVLLGLGICYMQGSGCLLSIYTFQYMFHQSTS